MLLLVSFTTDVWARHATRSHPCVTQHAPTPASRNTLPPLRHAHIRQAFYVISDLRSVGRVHYFGQVFTLT